jgi:hypothetical protein
MLAPRSLPRRVGLSTASLLRLVAFLAGLAACGGDAVVPPVLPVPTSVVVEPVQAAVEVGDAVVFTGRILDRFGGRLPGVLTWSSEDSRVASIDAQGRADGLTPGVVAVIARQAGLSGQASLTVGDSRPPTVTFVSPAPGAVVEGRVTLSVSVSDNHEVGRVTLQVDGTAVAEITPGAKSGSYGFTWDATGAQPGSHVLTVRAFDPSGNVSSVSLSLTVEAPPSPPSTACSIYPADNMWNTDISEYPVNQDSERFMARLGQTWRLSFADNLPINVIHRVRGDVPLVPILYTGSGDPGPMPIPRNAAFQVKDSSKLVVEDNHLVVMDSADCRLYELWSVKGPNADGSWTVGNGAVFDLSSNALRPDHKASSSASGLPVFVGIAREDEVRAGSIDHALSIPATLTQEGFIRPATTWQPDAVYQTKLPLVCATATFPFRAFCDQVKAGTFVLADPFNAPMGLRLRLKSDFDLSGYSGEALVLLTALKKYGLIVSDGSGTAGMMRGEKVRDPSAWDWSASIARQLSGVPATAFEVVDTGPILR